MRPRNQTSRLQSFLIQHGRKTPASLFTAITKFGKSGNFGNSLKSPEITQRQLILGLPMWNPEGGWLPSLIVCSHHFIFASCCASFCQCLVLFPFRKTIPGSVVRHESRLAQKIPSANTWWANTGTWYLLSKALGKGHHDNRCTKRTPNVEPHFSFQDLCSISPSWVLPR